MGAGWYVAIDDGRHAALPHGGKALTFAQFQLEEIARAHSLPELKAFFSADPHAVAAYFHAQGIETDADDLPDEEWFEPAEALPVVETILAKLPEYAGHTPSLEKVTADLTAIVAVLRDVATSGQRFHIATALPDLSDREK